MKQCTRCGLTKPLDGFGKDPTKPTGRMSHCRDCSNRARRNRYHTNLAHEQQRGRQYYADNRETVLEKRPIQYRRWLANNPDGHWIGWIKARHGLTPEQWFAMLQEQDGLCYLCEQPLPEDRKTVVIDHDHAHCASGFSCGVCRRGLAHANCNTGIGLLCDSPVLLRLAADNLERVQAVTAALMMTAPEQGELFDLDEARGG